MAAAPENNSLVLPQKGRRTAGSRDSAAALPADVLSQSAERLRILALLYAFVFVMAGYVPALLLPAERPRLLSSFLLWGPGVIAIAVALLVAAVIRSARVPLPAVMNIGLVFEVVGSYGIAAAEFLDPMGITIGTGHFGLSWVAVWTLLFTIVVPTPPRRALVAALAAASSVSVVVALVIVVYPNSSTITGLQFFVGLVLPYLLIVLMAYVGARVVYALGTEVSRARELGSYHLVERLGQGGMGEVWRAKHRMLARPAAIKLVRPSRTGDARSLASEDARRRFEQEAQAIASLRSPHTIELFDFGVADDGTFYYAMELLEGLDADALVRRTGPMPAERAIHVLQQVCHSLSEAHSRGLVHRDVKPANVFLCRYGEDYDFVKMLDFGIVKAAEEGADTQPALTLENAIHGTPAFIAPEQALGGSTIDGRADIYATGCVAYWLLTGELVFTADTPLGLVMQHVQTEPTPPSARTERRIPAALNDLVLSCLAKDPAQRPQTAKELSHRLAAIDGARAWTEDQARTWWTTHEAALGDRAQALNP
ncbi:MAG TPA: serine/threonine-protein kinase [Vicinamibacterales bacterium]|nr:serine/threonine-protein kinase [Vicinamibacterales bacterium]